MSAYKIREFLPDDLPLLSELGHQFASEAKIVKFNPDVFAKSWEAFIQSGVGVIYAAENDFGEVCGAIGALQFNDPNSGDLMANEMFWIVMPDHRGGCGMMLLNRLEQWARGIGCKYLWMNYLMDSMPEKVKSIYERKGFTLAETHWVKEM